MGIIQKRLKTYKKETGFDAGHLFSSSFQSPGQINKTNLFAEQWGSQWIVRSGLKYRFQVEAVSDQENYRSVIKAWEAAEKFDALVDLEAEAELMVSAEAAMAAARRKAHLPHGGVGSDAGGTGLFDVNLHQGQRLINQCP